MSADPESSGIERRKYVRLAVELPLSWKPLRPDESSDRPSIESVTVNIGSRGLAFATDVRSVEAGSYVTMQLRPSEGEGGPVDLEGVVTWARECDDGLMHVGVRILTAPEDGMHALMMVTHDKLGGYTCVCREVRHCGALSDKCEAGQQDKNCWQVENALCCYWKDDDRDCARCPVSILCFLE